MTSSADLLVDGFGRVREEVHDAVRGLSIDQLTWRADSSANSIAWLIWHLTRVQDDHLAGAGDYEQLWTTNGWAERFDLPFALDAIGYGHTDEEVAKVRADADLLLAYHDAVYERSIEFVATLKDADWDRIVDEAWDPPVTLAVRMISVLADTLEHVGQAAFVRGLLMRR